MRNPPSPADIRQVPSVPRSLIALWLGVYALFLCPSSWSKDTSLPDLEPFLKDYCVRCHGEEKSEAGIDLSGPVTLTRLLQEHEIWLHVVEQIETEEMPTKGPYPSKEEIASVTKTIGETVSHINWDDHHDPGRTTLARLTRTEYRNAVRDILGVDIQAGKFLTDDPEGNTGFTNDRESLSFPLFAFDDFLREAERAADTILGYGEEKFRSVIEFEEDALASPITTTPTPSGDGVVLRDANLPHQIMIEVPHIGMYEVSLHAYTFKGEPLSGLGMFINGAPAQNWVIAGTESSSSRTILNLEAGSHTIVFGYNGDLAPIIQNKVKPRSVPDRFQKEILKEPIPQFPLPQRFTGNEEAKKAWKRLNSVMAGYHLTGELAKLLLERGQTDYERHDMKHAKAAGILQSRNLNTFQPGKVAFNLAAGKVSVLLKIPQKQLESQLKQEIGFSHQEYSKSVNAYLRAFREKHPDRVRKRPGQIGLDRIEITSHALNANETAPAFVLEGLNSDASALATLQELATRAYSRPPHPEELAMLERIYDQSFTESESRSEALRDAIVGLLVSPPFLLRYTEGPIEQTYVVDDVEVARRLSHFLWMSLPDEELRTLALERRLSDPAVLVEQVDRMVQDPKFESFAASFTSEWLDLSGLSTAESLNGFLRMSMKEEPSRFVRDLFQKNRPVLDLVKSSYVYVNAKLADHYGLPPVEGQELKQVAIETKRRGGLLTMGATLVTTSTAERTSPVNRGVWIVELLLGEHLPPAPPSVPELKTNAQSRTIREELERHRSASECSRCHSKIDPYGFVLENYDQFGVWRTQEKGKPIDSSTTLDDGTKLAGLSEFQDYVLEHRVDDLTRNLTKRLLAFALGRETRYTDEATIRSIIDAVKAENLGARSLLHHVVLSEPFRKQNNSPVSPGS